MKKNLSLLKYNHSDNIGDNIQSLISKKILEQLGFKIDFINQNDLNKFSKKKNLFLNGFFCFSDNNKIFPFHKNITPYFSNFHLELDYNKNERLEKIFKNEKNINYIKKYEPVGCRDEETKNFFKKKGINAYNNECITFVINKRTKEEEINAKKIVVVDVDEFVPIPKEMKKNVEYKTHILPKDNSISNRKKLKIAENLLSYYKKNARLIVTTRFHCAIPCIAMGIPVIFFGDTKSKRLDPLKNYLNIYPYINLGKRNRSLFRKFNLLKNIPFISKNVIYCFNIPDLIYTFIYKLFLIFAYKFSIIKVDWNPKKVNIENSKNKKIKFILKLLNIKEKHTNKIRANIK